MKRSRTSWLVPCVVFLVVSGCSSSVGERAQSGGDAEVEVLSGHTEAVVHMTVLDDGRLASVADDGSIRMWDLRSGAADLILEADLSEVAALDQLSDGRLVAATHRGVHVWDLSDPTSPPLTIPDTVNTYSIAVFSDGMFALGNAEATVAIWDQDNLDSPVAVYNGHSMAGEFGSITSDIVELSDGKVASVAAGEVHIWDRGQPEVTIAARSGFHSIIELGDGTFASTVTNGRVSLWDREQPDRTALGYPGPAFYTRTTLIALDDGLLASRGDHLWVWDPVQPSVAVASYERDQATVAALLADGRFAVGYFDGEIHLWDPALG